MGLRQSESSTLSPNKRHFPLCEGGRREDAVDFLNLPRFRYVRSLHVVYIVTLVVLQIESLRNVAALSVQCLFLGLGEILHGDTHPALTKG
jgi:hypothetical protein